MSFNLAAGFVIRAAFIASRSSTRQIFKIIFKLCPHITSAYSGCRGAPAFNFKIQWPAPLTLNVMCQINSVASPNEDNED